MRFRSTALALAAPLVLASMAWADAAVVVARTGDAPPEGNGTFDALFSPVLNDAGQLGFTARLAGTSGGTSDDVGLYLSGGHTSPFTLTTIVRQSDGVPDGNGDFAGLADPLLNNLGQATFSSTLMNTSGGTVDDDGVFFFTPPASVAIIQRAGEPAPDGNGVFSFLNDFGINNSGQVAFEGRFQGTSGGSADSVALFRSDGAGSVQQLVRTGEPAPDGIGKFSFLFSGGLNESGQVAFASFLTGTADGISDDMAIYIADGASPLTLIAREGQAAPGGNGTFGTVDSHPVLNDLGQVAFRAELTGTSGGTADDFAIYRADAGGLVEIMRAGQTVPGGNGQFDGTPDFADLNNAGQVAFSSRLVNTSGGVGVDDSGIYRGDGSPGSLVEVARAGQAAPDGNGTLFAFDQPIMNELGQLAFVADLTGTAGGSDDDQAIYFWDEMAGLHTVAREGQPFDGSTILSLEFLPGLSDEQSGLNDLGQVAFAYTLADGGGGVAIWTIPEPTSLALFATGGLALLRRRRI